MRLSKTFGTYRFNGVQRFNGVSSSVQLLPNWFPFLPIGFIDYNHHDWSWMVGGWECVVLIYSGYDPHILLVEIWIDRKCWYHHWMSGFEERYFSNPLHHSRGVSKSALIIFSHVFDHSWNCGHRNFVLTSQCCPFQEGAIFKGLPNDSTTGYMWTTWSKWSWIGSELFSRLATPMRMSFTQVQSLRNGSLNMAPTQQWGNFISLCLVCNVNKYWRTFTSEDNICNKLPLIGLHAYKNLLQTFVDDNPLLQ